MSDVRKSYLRGYLLALLAEGGLEGISSPTAIAAKVASVLAIDIPTVLTEMAEVFVAQSGHQIGAELLGRVGDVVRDIGRRGVKAVWKDMQAQYARGLEVVHGKR